MRLRKKRGAKPADRVPGVGVPEAVAAEVVAAAPLTVAEQARADAHWKRLKNRTAAVGLVGVFKDITPGAETQKATFAYERIREDEIGSEGDENEDGVKKFILFQDRRADPLDDEEPFSVLVPNPDA